MKSIASPKLIIALNTITILLLVLYILFPTYAFGDDPIIPPPKTKEDPPSTNQSNTKQNQSTTVVQDETIVKNLFKDATYENFTPQDDAETKIFDEDLLGSQK